MKIALLLPLLLFIFSCQSSSTDSSKKEPLSKVCKSAKANTTQEFGVMGMVCKMGCGGSIRKALKETCAVERVDVNYIDSLEEQTIKVFYKREQIAPPQILSILAEINDKQFTVRTIGLPQKLK